MYLICFGTRPELIKLISLIHKFKENNIQFKTLFSGQHENLIKDFYKYIDEPVEPLWEFGFGLSYTNFSYKNLNIENTEIRNLIVS